MMGNTAAVRTVRQRIQGTLSSEVGRRRLKLALFFAGGFFLAAGALARAFQPLALGLLCASPGGWPAVLIALGGSLGYLVFWGKQAAQGVAWMAGGLAVAALAGDRGISRRQPMLLPALAALVVSGCGVVFQFRFQDETAVPVYLLRIGVAVGTTMVFFWQRERSGSWVDWLASAVVVLALAQVMPVRYLGLGYIAAGLLGAGGAFPAAVLAGLALDLSQVTNVKMTGVLCLGFCLRLIPRQPRWFPMLAPALAFFPVAVLSNCWDPLPLPGLVLGGALSAVFPGLTQSSRVVHRRGETAVAQVRLEQMSLVLRQMEQALLLARPPELDRRAVLLRSGEAACDTCPERRQCKARAAVAQLPEKILEQPGLSPEDLPPGCKKTGRLLGELRRGQEQLRRMKGDRNRLAAYRGACREQYGFLADYLQELSDDLATRRDYRLPRFQPEVAASTLSREAVNGDLCAWFAGTGNRYFVVLCDGMGTGTGAARESREAVGLLRQMLSVGFPAEYALRSLNSLSVLREAGGCVTVDLLQLQLDTGKGTLYKWGAAASYLMVAGQLRKIGTVCPPPGLSQQSRETVDRLSLGGGEVLILLSDGAGEEALLHSGCTDPKQTPGEMAAAILERGAPGGDDATAVVVRLKTSRASTQ